MKAKDVFMIVCGDGRYQKDLFDECGLEFDTQEEAINFIKEKIKVVSHKEHLTNIGVVCE